MTDTPPAHGCTIDGQPAMPILVSEYNRLIAQADPELRRQLDAGIRALGEAETELARLRARIGQAERAEAENTTLRTQLADAARGVTAARQQQYTAEQETARLRSELALTRKHQAPEWSPPPPGSTAQEERVGADTAQATLTVTVTAPDAAHAVRWAGHIRDLAHAEFGESMRLHTFIELEPSGTPEFDEPEETR